MSNNRRSITSSVKVYDPHDQFFTDRNRQNVFIKYKSYLVHKYTGIELTQETISRIENDVHAFTYRLVNYGIIDHNFKEHFTEFLLDIIDIRC